MNNKLISKIAGLLTGMVIAGTVYTLMPSKEDPVLSETKVEKLETDLSSSQQVTDHMLEVPEIDLSSSQQVMDYMFAHDKIINPTHPSLDRSALEEIADSFTFEKEGVKPLRGKVEYAGKTYDAKFSLEKIMWRTKHGKKCIAGKLYLESEQDDALILNCNYDFFDTDFRLPETYVEFHFVMHELPDQEFCDAAKTGDHTVVDADDAAVVEPSRSRPTGAGEAAGAQRADDP